MARSMLERGEGLELRRKTPVPVDSYGSILADWLDGCSWSWSRETVWLGKQGVLTLQIARSDCRDAENHQLGVFRKFRLDRTMRYLPCGTA